MVVSTVVVVLRCSCSAQECCLHLQLLVDTLFHFFGRFLVRGFTRVHTPALGTTLTLS